MQITASVTGQRGALLHLGYQVQTLVHPGIWVYPILNFVFHIGVMRLIIVRFLFFVDDIDFVPARSRHKRATGTYQVELLVVADYSVYQ
jgi:hypothetical protein